MVSPARRRRAWILLLVTWAVIAGVLIARYALTPNEEQLRLDREAAEQEALRQMDRLPPPPPAAADEPPADEPPGDEPASAAETGG